VTLPKDFSTAAIRAAKKLGLRVAGVDLMDSNSGPLVIEVNSSPGFEGIERATGLNIASQIVRYMIKTAKR
jgi:ribosomal protein S6--L-glutamate ligase